MKAPTDTLALHPPLPRRKRGWLLWLARRCYTLFLRSNGWKPVLHPSPIAGHGLVLKWEKRINLARYSLTMEDALITESRLHQARQKAEARAA